MTTSFPTAKDRAFSLLSDFDNIVDDFSTKAKGWLRPATIGHVAQYAGVDDIDAERFLDEFLASLASTANTKPIDQ